jgi:hypothetical protein
MTPLFADADPSFNRMLQAKFDTQWPRPLQSNFELTLANGKHFFKVYYSSFVNYLVRGDFKEIAPHICVFMHAVPYLVVANQAILDSDLENECSSSRETSETHPPPRPSAE